MQQKDAPALASRLRPSVYHLRPGLPRIHRRPELPRAGAAAEEEPGALLHGHLDGAATVVQAITLGEARQWEDVRHKTTFDAEAVLIDPRIVH